MGVINLGTLTSVYSEFVLKVIGLGYHKIKFNLMLRRIEH